LTLFFAGVITKPAKARRYRLTRTIEARQATWEATMRGCAGALVFLLGFALISGCFVLGYELVIRPADRTVILCWVVPILVFLMGCVLCWLVLRTAALDHQGKELHEARRNIAILQDAVAELQRRDEKQAVLLRTLFALLSERHGLTEADLLAHFRKVEAEKAGTPPRKCSRCGRPVNPRHHRCLYCGEACQVGSAFDLLEMGAWPNLPLPPTGEQGITTPGRE
jgi:hypothetical protein